MAEDKKEKDVGRALDPLIVAACKAYGINPKWIFGSAVRDGVAIVVTSGGKRVRYRAGDTVVPLDEISVTGINPNAKKCKRITGPAKE